MQPTSETSTKENRSPPCRDNVPYQSESSTSPPSLVTPLKASQTTSSKDAPILFTDSNTTDSLSPADEKASNKPWDSGIEDSSRSTDSSILEDLEISLDSTDFRSIVSELDIKGSKSSPPADRLELDQEEANQILEQLMKGYQCVQPFSKNLTDEELEDIFKYGLVSTNMYAWHCMHVISTFYHIFAANDNCLFYHSINQKSKSIWPEIDFYEVLMY